MSVVLIPANESKDHYPKSLVKLSKLYFLSDMANFLKQGLKKKIAFNIGKVGFI